MLDGWSSLLLFCPEVAEIESCVMDGIFEDGGVLAARARRQKGGLDVADGDPTSKERADNARQRW